MIDLYTAPTPNGWKASVTLEEMAIPYEVHAIDFGKGMQKEPWFLKINPNGRIPAIVDRDENNLAVFESGEIMIYLAEKIGSPLLPTARRPRAEVLSWLMFQMGGVGPMMGQANVFGRYWHEVYQPAIDRYRNESRRLFEVLDSRLADRDYLSGEYSIADIANWCWVRIHPWSGVSVEGLEHLQKWIDRIAERPAVQRGVAVPASRAKLDDTDSDAARKTVESARSMLQR